MGAIDEGRTAVFKFRPAVGSHSYKAVFLGTTANAGSTSTASALTVTGIYPSTTSIGQSGSFDSYTLSATVGGTASVAPTGTVSFLDTSNGNAVLGTASLGAGTGSLSFLNIPNAAGGGAPIAVGDFNGDGIPDLAVTDGDAIKVLLGKGDGTFTAGVSVPIAQGVFGIAVADFNGDGKLDLAVISKNPSGATGTVIVLLGNGDGTFTVLPNPILLANEPMPAPSTIVVSDFNEDGIPDLAVLTYNNTVAILLGKGDGSFPTEVPYATGSKPISVAAGNLNGDNALDLAVANLADNTVSVLMGNGDGTFQSQVTYPKGTSPYALVANNFAGLGPLDLAVANSGASSVTILRNNGSGVFIVLPYSTGAGPIALAAGDLNGDGLPDLAVVDNSANTVSALLNESSAYAKPNLAGFNLPGTHVLEAVYSGDANFSGSTSAGYSIVNPTAATRLALTSNVNPSNYGNSVTLTATLSPYLSEDTSTNGETVTFTSNGASLGTGTLSYGVATLTTSTLPVGTNPIQASYPGDNEFNASTSAAFELVVRPATLTVMGPDVSRSYGAANPPLTGTVSGAVNGDTFTVTGTTTATVTSPPGGYPVVPSVSGAHLADYTVKKVNGTLTVVKATPAVTVTPGSSTITSTQALSVTVAVSAGTGNPAPTGSVTLSGGGYTSAATGLSGGSAKINIPGGSLATGSDTLSAAYTPNTSSSSTYTSATGSISVTVNNPAPATTSPLSPASAVTGSAGLTLTVNGSNFVKSSSVQWNGSALATTYQSATQVTAVVPANYILTAETASVTVFNPTPGGGTSSPALTFTINNPVPGTTSLSPINALAGGLGFTLTVNGSNFFQRSTVNWNGAALATTYVSATRLQAAVPASDILAAGTASVTVVNPTPGDGSSSPPLEFVVYVPAALTSPAVGAVLCGSMTFKWTAGAGPTAYWLYLGTTGQDASNLYSSGSTTALSETVTVPCDGVTVFAKFLQRVNGAWLATYYTYTEGGTLVPAVLTSPTPGSVLGASAHFTWTSGSGPSAFWFNLGTTGVDATNLYNSGSTTALSANVTGLPTNGVTVYVRFSQRIDGVWQHIDYIYGGGGPIAATLKSPAPLAVLGSSATFTWTTGAGVTAYWLYLGTTGVGAGDLYSSGSTKATSVTVNNLPKAGVTVFARLLSRINGAWVSADYTYTEGGTLVPAAITSPANKSILPGSSVKFSWAGGAGPSEYWLYLGSTGQGSSNLYSSGATMATSVKVTGLPTTGAKVYAKFLQRIDGAWQTTYYTYTAQ